MPPPERIGEANPVAAKLASALFHKKPAHRAAMPGFFDADSCRIDAFHHSRLYTTSMGVAKSARG
jgi:hypothetical protein